MGSRWSGSPRNALGSKRSQARGYWQPGQAAQLSPQHSWQDLSLQHLAQFGPLADSASRGNALMERMMARRIALMGNILIRLREGSGRRCRPRRYWQAWGSGGGDGGSRGRVTRLSKSGGTKREAGGGKASGMDSVRAEGFVEWLQAAGHCGHWHWEEVPKQAQQGQGAAGAVGRREGIKAGNKALVGACSAAGRCVADGQQMEGSDAWLEPTVKRKRRHGKRSVGKSDGMVKGNILEF